MKANYHGFQRYKQTAEKCWQYTLDFVRGLACGVCDNTSRYKITGTTFNISHKECLKFSQECASHLKSFRVIRDYISLFSQVAICHERGTSQPKAHVNKDLLYLSEVEKCMYNKDMARDFSFAQSNSKKICIDKKCLYWNAGSRDCLDLCVKHLPWSGITKDELITFPYVLRDILTIKAAFPKIQSKKNADSIVSVWSTDKDKTIQAYLTTASIALDESGFEITKWFSKKATGLMLSTKGESVHDFLKSISLASPSAASISHLWLGMTIFVLYSVLL